MIVSSTTIDLLIGLLFSLAVTLARQVKDFNIARWNNNCLAKSHINPELLNSFLDATASLQIVHVIN